MPVKQTPVGTPTLVSISFLTVVIGWRSGAVHDLSIFSQGLPNVETPLVGIQFDAIRRLIARNGGL